MRRAVRLLFHLSRLVPLIFLGALVRLVRRMLGRKPRIWHGLSPLFWEPWLVQSTMRAGYPVRFVLHDSELNREVQRAFPELRLLGPAQGIRPDEIHWAALRDLFWRGDIQMAYFDIFYFGPSLRWANELAMRLMKLCGIRIIVMAHGGDVTYRTRYRSRFDWVGRVQLNNPRWDLVETAPGTIWRIDTYCKYADLVLPGDAAMWRFLPRNDLLFKYFPVDTDALPYTPVRDSGVPIIVHAPSARAIKGTEHVLTALDNLKAKGIAFELVLVEKRPRHEALQIYATADVVVDQLCIGAYGTLAVEAMALGKPTLTYLDQEHLGDPVFNMPVVNANPENVERVLAVLLQVPKLRKRIGAESRKAAETYQSIDALAEIWKQLFAHVWNGAPLRLETTRQFDPSRRPRSFTEDPARVDFWPVPADDLMDEITAAPQETMRYDSAPMTNIPIARPLFGSEEIEAAARTLESGWIVQGPRVAEFEQRFAAYTGAKHALACSNGTTALHLANAALRLGPGDEVLVPAFTWVATPNSVVYCGATPVFCDIDLATYNVAPEEIERRITKNTKGILPVHMFGLCAEMEPVLDAARRHELWVVEDAACAFGATWRGKHAGTIGDAGTFSFHPRKSITTGEGGMVTTAREDVASAVRSMRDHGVGQRRGEPSYLLPDYDEVGFNYRLTDLQAAVGLAQMDRAEHILAERRRRARIYDEALAALPWLRIPIIPEGLTHGYQAYVCLVAPEEPSLRNVEALEQRRNALMAKLDARGIATRQGTHAPVLRSAYRQRGVEPNDYPNAVLAEKLSLALPLYPQMTDEEQGRVIDALRESGC